MYGMYYDLPMDNASLIFDEMVKVVNAKVKEQTGTRKKGGKNPKNLSYPRFFSVLLEKSSDEKGVEEGPCVATRVKGKEVSETSQDIDLSGE